MRKKIALLTILLFSTIASGCAFSGCNSDTPTSVQQQAVLTLNKHELTLDTYQTYWLLADYTGNSEVEWSVSDSTVLSVEDGKLVGLKAGTATVTVKAGALKDTCTVTVKGYNPELLEMELEEHNLVLYKSETSQIFPKVKYGETDVTAPVDYEYVSSDTAIAEISKSGLITAKQVGSASITVFAVFETYELATTVNVEVVSSGNVIIEQDGVELYALPTLQGETFENSIKLTATAYEKGVEQTGVTIAWSAEVEQDVLTVSNGVVTAQNAGTAQIFAKYTDKEGNTVTDAITVTVKPVSIELNKTIVTAKAEIQNGFELNTNDVFGENVTLEKAWIKDGELFANLSVADGKIDLNSIGVGEKKLYVQSRNIVCGLQLQLWTARIGSTKEMEVLYKATDGWYCLTDDVDMSGTAWEYAEETEFSGYFEGGGYKISGLTVNGNGGLFNTLSKTAKIKNVNLLATKIGKEVVGGVLAKTVKNGASVTVENVYLQVDNAGMQSGGLIASVYGEVSLKNVSGVVTKFTDSDSNGALFGNMAVDAVTDNVKIYSGFPACGNGETDNATAQAFNSRGLTVAPTVYKKVEKILDYETQGVCSLTLANGTYSGYTVYGNTVRSEMSSNGTVQINEADVEGRFGGYLDVLFDKVGGGKEYYTIAFDSTVYLTQKNFAKYVKTQNGNLILTEDVVLSGSWTNPLKFTGTFDGQGYSISGLNVAASKGLYQSLNHATVKNLVIVDVILGNQSGTLSYAAGGEVKIENVYISLAAQKFSAANEDHINQTYFDVNNRYKGGMIGRLMDETTTLSISDCVVYMPEFTTTASGFIAGFSKVPTNVKNTTFIGGNGLLNGIREEYEVEPSVENVTITDAVKAHKTYKSNWSNQNKAAYENNHPYVEITAANFETVMPTLKGHIAVLKEDCVVTDEWNALGMSAKATFTGVFDGAGYKISGLLPTVNDAGGVFYAVIGSVKNLAIEGSLKNNNGLLCDNLGGTVGITGVAYLENVYVEVKSSSTYQDGAPLARYLYRGDLCMKNVVTNIIGNNLTPGFITIKSSEALPITLTAENCYSILPVASWKGSLMYKGDVNDGLTHNETYFSSVGVYLGKDAFDAEYGEGKISLTELAKKSLYPNA